MKITNTAKRLRLINMRECLRQVQRLLPATSIDRTHSQFICRNLTRTDCSEDTIDDTSALVMRSLKGQITFNEAMERLNPGRYFDSRNIMMYRHQWIDQLCNFLSKEIARLA